VVGVAFSADNFIIARTLGAVNVPEYSIPQRMFAVVTMMSGMLVAPLWPAYGEAISRGDIKWVRHTFRKSLIVVVCATSAASCILLLLSHRLIDWWVGPHVHPPFLLLLGLAIWTVIGCSGDCVAMFMNGGNVIRFQVLVSSIFGFGCVLAKIFFIRRFGIEGVPWATISAYIVLSALPCALYLPSFFKRLGAGKAVPPTASAF